MAKTAMARIAQKMPVRCRFVGQEANSLVLLARIRAMKAKAVHKLGDEELTIEVDTLRKRMFELKNQSVTEKIQDTSQYGKIRKDIARLLSEQTVRSMSTQGKASSQ